MIGRHSSSGLSGELIELAGGDAFVDAKANLLCHEHGIAVIGVQAVAQLLQARRDLVEVDSLAPPVPLDDVHLEFGWGISSNGWWVRIGIREEKKEGYDGFDGMEKGGFLMGGELGITFLLSEAFGFQNSGAKSKLLSQSDFLSNFGAHKLLFPVGTILKDHFSALPLMFFK